MIARYTLPGMEAIWTEQNKFNTWLKVELAVIDARVALLRIPPSVAQTIKEKATFTVKAIELLEKETNHDMNAFIDVVSLSLPEETRKHFHDGLTSYDTEVPAQAIQLTDAINIIIDDLEKLIAVLRKLAGVHAWTFCMGITHGQDAEPTTFGWRLCCYLDLMEKALLDLRAIKEEVEQIKCSGAVGNYLTIDPELEAKVAEILEFDVRPAATQIVARDVHARLLSALAIMGGGIEKMADDFWLLATSAYGEVREPRSKRQKGSSAMPHKRNPIMLERFCGMSIMLRGYSVMGMELINTSQERDIAHSCVERVALPDAFCIADYCLQKVTGIVEGLEINRERMAENLGRTYGIWASEKVKLLLRECGVEPGIVYEYVQRCAFKAQDEKRPFNDVLWETPIHTDPSIPQPVPLSALFERRELVDCFSFVSTLKDRLPVAYNRMSIDLSLAFTDNL